jgi:hypothetical protein
VVLLFVLLLLLLALPVYLPVGLRLHVPTVLFGEDVLLSRMCSPWRRALDDAGGLLLVLLAFAVAVAVTLVVVVVLVVVMVVVVLLVLLRAIRGLFLRPLGR